MEKQEEEEELFTKCPDEEREKEDDVDEEKETETESGLDVRRPSVSLANYRTSFPYLVSVYYCI